MLVVCVLHGGTVSTIHSQQLFDSLQQYSKRRAVYLVEKHEFLAQLATTPRFKMPSPYCPVKFQSDRQVVMACLQKTIRPEDVQYMSVELKNCKQIANFVLDKFGAEAFQYLGELNRDRRDIVHKMILKMNNHQESAMAFVSKLLRDDLIVVNEAIKVQPLSFMHASERLRSDKDLILIVAKKNAVCLNYIPYNSPIFDSEQVFIELLSHKDWKSSGIRNQIKLCTMRVQKLIFPLLLKRFSNALDLVDPVLSSDKDFIESNVKFDCHIIRYIPENCWNHALTERVIRSNFKTYQFLPRNQRDNLEILLYVVSFRKGEMMRFAPEIMKEDEQIARKVVEKNSLAIQWFSPSIKDNIHIAELACSKIPNCGPSVKGCKELATKVLSLNVKMFKYLSRELKQDKDMARFQSDPVY